MNSIKLSSLVLAILICGSMHAAQPEVKRAAAQPQVAPKKAQPKFTPHPPAYPKGAKPKTAQEIKMQAAEVHVGRPAAPTRPAPRMTKQPTQSYRSSVELLEVIRSIREQRDFNAQDAKRLVKALQAGAQPAGYQDSEGKSIFAAVIENREIIPKIWSHIPRHRAQASRFAAARAGIRDTTTGEKFIALYGLKHSRGLSQRNENVNAFRVGMSWLAFVNTLLLFGADVNATSANGSTALLDAMRNGWDGYAAALMLMGASITHRDNDGDTILHFAFRWPGELVSLFEKLKSSGQLPDLINARNKKGQTPLMCALENWEPSIGIDEWHDRQIYFASAELLLKFGADPFIENNQGKNGVEFAAMYAPEILKQWREKYIHVLHEATPMATAPIGIVTDYLTAQPTPQGEQKKEGESKVVSEEEEMSEVD